jgi:pentatricopeptide repeat protein
MKAHQIAPNIITFNTVLNAFAQSGTMQEVPAILNDMKTACPPVEADIVTYSTLVKGFCQAGNLDRALKIFKDMLAEGKCTPDDVMFNSLLGGCVQESRPDEALQLLRDMRTSKIAPSNYTLSMIIKLMSRRGRLDEAFAIIEDTRKEYQLKINIQVYTCLIQGCLHNGQAGKAFAVYEKMMSDREPLPDATTYTVLVRGCIRFGITDKAKDLARQAHGIGMPGTAAPGLNAGCLDELITALGGEDSEEGAALLSELRSH